MSTPFISDQTFKGIDFTSKRLSKGDYENCIFDSCTFSKGVSFWEYVLTIAMTFYCPSISMIARWTCPLFIN